MLDSLHHFKNECANVNKTGIKKLKTIGYVSTIDGRMIAVFSYLNKIVNLNFKLLL